MYPLVNVYITMENHHVLMGKSTISMAIFNSYVCLPERVTLDQNSQAQSHGEFNVGPEGNFP